MMKRKWMMIVILALIMNLVTLAEHSHKEPMTVSASSVLDEELNVDFSLGSLDNNSQQAIYNFLIENSAQLPEGIHDFTMTVQYIDQNSGLQHIALVPTEVYDSQWSIPLPEEHIIRLVIQQNDSQGLKIDFLHSADILHSANTSDYRFPWSAGHTWLKTQGFHYNNLGYSLDFVPNGNPPSVLAIEEGTLRARCYTPNDPYQAMVTVSHANGVTSGYLHIKKNTVPNERFNTQITRGTYLGDLFNQSVIHNPACEYSSSHIYNTACGCGTAMHLHFETNSLISIQGHSLQSISSSPSHTPYTSNNDTDSNPPTKAANVRPDGWAGPYTDDTTPSFKWDAASDSDSGIAGYYVAVDDWTPEGTYGNDWWAGNVTEFTVPNALSDGQHHFAVTSKDNAGNVNPNNTNQQGDAPYYTFYVDANPPSAPDITISGAGCTGIQNNAWQNTCYDPAFTWDATDSGSGVKDYRYYWSTSSNGIPTIQTTDTSFDPGAISAADGYARYYLNVTARDNMDHESGVSTFGLLYDNTTPTATLQINNGAETANQVDVTLNLSAGDTGSGVDAVCVSNNANDCTDWQPYADVIPWTIPVLNRREHTVYVWVRDKAGNEASASDTITLDLYPPKPHSASYRICDDVIDVGGGVGLTSTTYLLVSAIGQPWATGAEANASDAFGGRSGFLSSITGCLPITYAITSNYTVTQWVIASGGNLRGSASYRLGDTTGQPAASDTNAFTSTNYTLSSGFWAQITGTVPPTSTINPAPIPPTPTPSPTPGPTPTPQPGGFGVSINEGALYTNDSDVTVSVWAPNVTHIRLSNDGGFADSTWRSYQVTSTWVISTYGSYVMPRFVYAQFRDAQNTIYGTYVDDIIYDPVDPQGQVQVLGSEFVTATLWLEAYDDNSGVSEMRIADSFEELNSALWEPYDTTRSWVPDNSRVYVQFKDRAGNESLIYDSTGAAHALDSRPTGVSIQGQASGARDTDHYFIASVSPTTVTLPLTYTWQATGQAPVTHAHQLDASDVVSFTWETAGPKIITATAANSLGAVSNVHIINISSLTAEVSKTVTPEDQVNYGDELTYTLVISAEAGTQLSLYDPMTETTCLHFVEPLTGVECVDNVITGTVEISPTNQVTVSFVAQVGAPGTVGWTTDVSNQACVYPINGTIEEDCIWSNEVTNEAFRPYGIFLPLVLRE